MDNEDELNVQWVLLPVQCAPPGVCILRYLLRPASGPCLCIQCPQREWSIRSFHVPEHVGFITVPPSSLTPLPEAQQWPGEPRVAPPDAVSFPFPVFFFKMLWLAGTAQPASKQTAESTLSTLRTYCTAKQFHTENFDLIGMKHEDSREDKNGVCVVLRGHVGKIW